MSVILPTVAAPKGRLTEREVRVLGASANRIVNLRGLQACPAASGGLTVHDRQGGHVHLSLTQADVEAVLALLVEREAALLIQFDVELDAPAS